MTNVCYRQQRIEDRSKLLELSVWVSPSIERLSRGFINKALIDDALLFRNLLRGVVVN